MVMHKIAQKLGKICTKKKNISVDDYTESNVVPNYIFYILQNIFYEPGKQKYRMFVTVNGELDNMFENIVNILVYKEGCEKLAEHMGIRDDQIIQFTIICQNKTHTVPEKLGTRSAYILLSQEFFKTIKRIGYKYVILEAANNAYYPVDIKDRKAEYGRGASLHLLSRYAASGFYEDPNIALKYDCFDALYPYNSMILDLRKITTNVCEKVSELLWSCMGYTDQKDHTLMGMEQKIALIKKEKNPGYKKVLAFLGSNTASYEEKLNALGEQRYFAKIQRTIDGGSDVCCDCGKLKR